MANAQSIVAVPGKAGQQAVNPKTVAQVQQRDTHDQRDLRAQEDMAFWAGAMFWAALATLAVTALGTFLIWRQVRLTRRAVEDTRDATVAMREANQIAMDNHKAEMRPYLYPTRAWFRVGDDHEPTAFIEFKNFGQSPAVDTEGWHHIWVEHFPLRVPLPEAPDDLPKGRAVIGPGGTSEVEHPRGGPLTPLERQEIEAGRAALYVFGRTTYGDIFGQAHWSQFVFFASGKDALKRGKLSPYLRGNALNGLAESEAVPLGV